MMSHMKLFLFAGLLGCLIGLTAGCQSRPPLVEPSMQGVSVGLLGDICPAVVVEAGEQVTWTNQDDEEHIIRHVPAEGEAQFSSGTLQPGDSFAVVLPEPGTFVYICSPDGTNTGSVIVQ